MTNLNLRRLSDDGDSTLGALYLNNKLIAFTLEDESRDKKVKGETCIPAGMYKLGIRKVVTPLTEHYRGKYPFFKYHIEILNVPNFSSIYIHVGNSEKHTDGCVLLGATAEIHTNKAEWIGKSAVTYEKFYKTIYSILEKGDLVSILIEEC